MISMAGKIAMTRASGIWLLLAGAALMLWGLISLGIFFVYWGFGDRYPAADTFALVFIPAIIPGGLFLYSGYSILLQKKWWLGLVCMVFLCAGSLWLWLIGVSWYIALPVIPGTIIFAVLLMISKGNFCKPGKRQTH
jgi:hypothetical protein